MVSPLALFLATQIILVIVLSSIGLIAARRHAHALQHEIETENPSTEGYLRFAVVRNRLAYPVSWNNRLWSTILIGIPLLSLVASYYPSSIPNPLSFFFQINVLYPFYLAVGIGNTIGSYAYSFLRTLLSDARAVRVFQISSLRLREIAMLKIREALLQTLPLVLFMEAVAFLLILAPSQILYYVLALLLTLCAGGAVVLDVLLDAPLFTFKNAVKPLARTQWADLAPRIAAWEHLGKMKFSSVLIQQDIREISSINILGLGKPTLVIGDFFLRHSEWRQQDALIAVAIGMVKQRIARHALVSRLTTWAIIAVSVLLFLLSSQLPSPLSSLTIAAPWVGMFIVFDRARSYSQRKEAENFTEVYRIASLLTGDPNAVRVALSVNSIFNGATVEQAQQDGQMQKLDELAQQSWEHAPHADEPVPTVNPISFDPYPLTASLDHATTPAPVPAIPYGKLV